ncbi:hypothetical protein CEUSTIGMA_g1030.t1 [Chlamydomonas eustigma]|uniref:Tafazzin family protein n=1 Tax=Chlamydomonas eustigma TaxID=1157962 RepID=A0A250WSA6_9CHLO|nr:hypothetical protein CEUSTIGMA_g1030.t1 [Chlamydomonas eustigma]|eukprot:GAX73579.1 hypothetical protein CEUSTIGMA_g1030.t1 [Chlamydomonas eustigma]
MDALEQCQIDEAITSPPWGQIGRAFTLGIISGACKLVLNVINTTSVENHDIWLKHVMNRELGRGLITISNHTTLVDDPGVISAITPWWYFWSEPQHHGMRWSMCAKEVCFKNDLLRQFFANGKVMPIVRGGGVDQPVMTTAANQVATGGWLHVFPEGRIMMTGKLGPFRWGVGKVVCDAKKASGGKDPIILPIFHSNMAAVLPLDTYMVRAGKQISVTIGEPLDLTDITCRCHQPGQDQQKVWKDITLRMHHAMSELQERCPGNPYQRENPPGKPGAASGSTTQSVGTDKATEAMDPRLDSRA